MCPEYPSRRHRGQGRLPERLRRRRRLSTASISVPIRLKGWPVDANGCPLDTDGDGVPDGKDKCAATRAGLHGRTPNGCQADTDGDGRVRRCG
jgi:hypothetical protein